MKEKNIHKPSKFEQKVWKALAQVLDPELGINIVSLGLIYTVLVEEVENGRFSIQIVMTLTTPGCPLADSFDGLVRQSLSTLPNLDSEEDVAITLTFDPPWTTDMMTDEAKAELGLPL